MFKHILLISLLFLVVPFSEASDRKPSGLLTDLIENTNIVYLNGYASSLSLQDIEKAIEPVQYAKIASSHPSFSWIVPGSKPGTKQMGYRIIVSDTYQNAVSGIGTIWDSGLVKDSQSSGIIYKGAGLQPDKTYFWRVKTITNTEDESDWSDVKAFRTADSLSEYGVSYYPLVKNQEYPVAMNTTISGTQVVDFGKASFGQLVLTLASECADTIYVYLGEKIKDNCVDKKPGGSIRYQRYSLPLLKGTHSYRIKIAKDRRNTGNAAIKMPDYIGEVLPFRYCEIEGYKNTIAKGQVMRESVYYPFDDSSSSFQCSDSIINQVWDLSKYSIKATSFTGVYVDGDRERIPYEADALINQLCHYSVDREYSMARRSHEYLLQHPTWPTEWILQSVLIAWNDYLYTGDSRSLKANYNILKARTLLQLKDKNGLISTTTGLQTPDFLQSIRFKGTVKDIVDWPHTGILGLNDKEGGEIDGFVFSDYNAVVNAYHFEALKLLARIAEVLSFSDEANNLKKQSEQFKQLFNKVYYDDKLGSYVDGVNVNHASLHSNMFALVFGLVPEKNKKSVVDFIKSRGMVCSVYGSQFFMDALYEGNEAEYALSMLNKTDDRSWYNMIRLGSTITLEAWDNKYKPNLDWNHAWGAAPANIIPRKLMGIEPMSPGFSSIRIKPQLGSLTWAKAIIPTIKGEVYLYIEKQNEIFNMEVHIPANMEADVYLPLPDHKHTIKCNGNALKSIEMKNEKTIYLGKFVSGKYKISVDRK